MSGVVVAYCTDVEGNYDYWERYIALSQVVNRSESTGRLTLSGGSHFVFGGDVCDRGNGDIRVLQDLIGMHDDYAGRVHFILGNRDVNKMRIPVEVHEKHLAREGATYWAPPDGRPAAGTGRVDRMKWILAKTMGSPQGGFEFNVMFLYTVAILLIVEGCIT